MHTNQGTVIDAVSTLLRSLLLSALLLLRLVIVVGFVVVASAFVVMIFSFQISVLKMLSAP